MKLINADCLDVMREMPDNSVDLVLTDPPYGEVNARQGSGSGMGGKIRMQKGCADDVDFDYSEMLHEIARVCRGSFYVFCGYEQFSGIVQFFRSRRMPTRCCVWRKSNIFPMNGQHLWLPGIELFCFAKKPGAPFFEHCKNTDFKYAQPANKFHPTQKPIALMERLILASSAPGAIVFDPFMGSGTTGIACRNLGREFIGIERDAEYFQIASNRIQHTPTQFEIPA